MTRTYLIVFLVVVLIGAAGYVTYQKITGDNSDSMEFASPSPSPSMTASPTDDVSPSPAPIQTLEGGLQVQDLRVGDGEEAKAGMTVSVLYVGYLTDGKPFDSSTDPEKPFTFQLGAGKVIEGWDVGLVGMKVNGVRNLFIPAAMAYGSRGAGDVIPPNADLIFQVQLLGVGK